VVPGFDGVVREIHIDGSRGRAAARCGENGKCDPTHDAPPDQSGSSPKKDRRIIPSDRRGREAVPCRYTAARLDIPPSMVTMVPLVYADRSEARNTTLAAISSTVAGRPNGFFFSSSA